MEKILTIIIPAYNTEKYILRCLESVKHPLFHVVIIDDGSTDKTPFILDEYCKTHPDFQVLHTPNKGAAAARVLGLSYVDTTYFSFVDSDDVVNTNSYLLACLQLMDSNYKVLNGRMSVYLPGCPIRFDSRVWEKDDINFQQDKLEFSNTTCSLLDKIWHRDCLRLFREKSTQVVYEDMEFVYYVLAKKGKMMHTNSLIYNYCMRGIDNQSTSAIQLDMRFGNGIHGLFQAYESMKKKFVHDQLFSSYQAELEAILIKLVYQRIYNIFVNKSIVNKKEMIKLVLEELTRIAPEWTSNLYLSDHFKNSEYNDYLFYLGTQIAFFFYHLDIQKIMPNQEDFLESYTQKIILKPNSFL